MVRDAGVMAVTIGSGSGEVVLRLLHACVKSHWWYWIRGTKCCGYHGRAVIARHRVARRPVPRDTISYRGTNVLFALQEIPAARTIVSEGPGI